MRQAHLPTTASQWAVCRPLCSFSRAQIGGRHHVRQSRFKRLIRESATFTAASTITADVVLKDASVRDLQIVEASAATALTPAANAPIPKPTKLFNIVFVTSEAAPWSKTGGLGDVCGSLPPALAARGHRVMVVTPRYGDYKDIHDSGLRIRIDALDRDVGFYVKHDKGVDWVFVDNECYPRPGGLYADNFGVYGDNQLRFALLCLAALEAPLQLPLQGSLYGEDCIFIANDWHAAMTPIYLAAKYRKNGVYLDARSVLAIHNLRHQGVFPPSSFNALGLPGDWYKALEWQYPPHQRQGAYEEEGRAVNTLKGGLTTADRVVTVSPGYATEIQSYPGGCDLQGLLSSRSYVLSGVLNGIDHVEWNPRHDPHIPQKYDISNFSKGKRANKVALQKELSLPVDPEIPMIGFIGRLDQQKGADLVLQCGPELLAENVQLVCLGTGDQGLEAGMRWLENAHLNKARCWVGFNVPVSHKITAACDLLLMPSRFEPCGLNQLYAMAYGTVPIAHATGGLKDTVIPFNPWDGTGTGWTFSPCERGPLMEAIRTALDTYWNHPDSFRALQQRGMERNSSWEKAASEYEQIFSWAKMDSPYCN